MYSKILTKILPLFVAATVVFTLAPATIASAGTVTETPKPTTVSYPLGSVVVKSGSSAQISTSLKMPANINTATLKLTGTGAWRNTAVSVAAGEEAKKFAFTARPNEQSTGTVTINVPANTRTLTIWSSQASVKVAVTVLGYSTAVTPTPVVTPKPVVTVKPVATATPVTSTMPDRTNTGVPNGTSLKVYNGDLRITTNGTVIDGLDIHGRVSVLASNVTIKNSIVRGNDSFVAEKGILIHANSGTSNLRVIDTELVPTIQNEDSVGILGNNFTLTRVNIHHVIDSAHITGSNVTIQRSWLHDNLHYKVDPNWNAPSHDDSIQIQSGTNINIIGNTLTGSHTSGVMVTQDRGAVSALKISGNYINNGACSINIAEKSYGPLKGVSITDNTFGRDTRLANCAIIAKTTTTALLTLSNNFYTDGVAVTVRRG